MLIIASLILSVNIVYSQSGKCIFSKLLHSNAVTSLSFNPDASSFVSSSLDGKITTTTIDSKQSVNIENYSKIWDVEYSTTGNYILGAADNFNFAVYDAKTGKPIKNNEFGTYFDSQMQRCNISQNENYFAVSRKNFIWLCRLNRGRFEKQKKVDIEQGEVTSLLYTNDEKNLIVGTSLGEILIYDVISANIIRKIGEDKNSNTYIKPHLSNVWGIAIDPFGKFFASASEDGIIKIYNLTDYSFIYSFQAHQKCINSILFLKNGIIVSASDDNTIKFWDCKPTQSVKMPIATFNEHRGEIWCMSISQDRNYLATGSADGVVKIWDISDFENENNQTTVNNYKPKIDISTVDVKNENNKPVENSKLLLITPVASETENEVVKPEPKVNNQQTTTQYSIKPIISETENEVIEPEPKVNNQQTITQNITTPVSIVNKNIENEVDSIMFFEQNSKKNTFVLIIGNEDYSKSQTTAKTEINVPFAINDADVFKTYCIKLLGIPENQIIILKDGTSAQMKRSISKLKDFSQIENGNAELIFYYSGHGLPNEQTKEPFLIPVDVNGADLTDAISLSFLFKSLTEYPTQRITVFLDACFSGGARNMPLVTKKSMTVNPEKIELNGKIVVFASSQGTESSGVYEEKKHGYFTYFLLKKLKDTKGDVNYKELFDYLKYEVSKQSLIDDKKQTPTLNVSPEIQNDWGAYKLK